MRAFPDAGEAIIFERRPAPDQVERLRSLGKPKGSADPNDDDEAWAERQESNRARSIRRSTVRSRRYIVSNRLRYMWVLTRLGGEGLHGPEGRAQCMALVAAFAIELRTELGHDFPYWFSPELHPAGKQESREECPIPDVCGCGGHGWHVNFFVREVVNVETMKALWRKVDEGNGYEIRYKDWTRDSRLERLPYVEKLRAGARYGAKYASKDWAEAVVLPGCHRYEVAEGFAPRELVADADNERQAVELLEGLAGVDVRKVWCSDDCDEWEGPRCWLYEWAPRRDGP